MQIFLWTFQKSVSVKRRARNSITVRTLLCSKLHVYSVRSSIRFARHIDWSSSPRHVYFMSIKYFVLMVLICFASIFSYDSQKVSRVSFVPWICNQESVSSIYPVLHWFCLTDLMLIAVIDMLFCSLQKQILHLPTEIFSHFLKPSIVFGFYLSSKHSYC